MDQVLYWKDHGGFLLRCLDKSKINLVTIDMYQGACRGHKYWKDTTFKMLRACYYWTKVFSYFFSQVRACVECQTFAGKPKLLSLPLKPISVEAPFHQWGLDFHWRNKSSFKWAS